MNELGAIAIAGIWPVGIFWVTEAIGRAFIKHTRHRGWLMPLIPLALGVISAAALVPMMIATVDFVESMPALHQAVVGLGAGGFAIAVHDSKQGIMRREDDD
jgi:NADH:ubiquinone oxidoreductase subunit 5 (subunit L)/multisubunit Na+/H+ antiporter MnhA subunit